MTWPRWHRRGTRGPPALVETVDGAIGRRRIPLTIVASALPTRRYDIIADASTTQRRRLATTAAAEFACHLGFPRPQAASDAPCRVYFLQAVGAMSCIAAFLASVPSCHERVRHGGTGPVANLLGGPSAGHQCAAYHATRYNGLRDMVASFANRGTEDLFDGVDSRAPAICPRHLWSIIWRKLDQLNCGASLADLAVPPGNRLEQLRGDRAGQHSIRVNARYRVCFRWENGHAADVEVVDYH